MSFLKGLLKNVENVVKDAIDGVNNSNTANGQSSTTFNNNNANYNTNYNTSTQTQSVSRASGNGLRTREEFASFLQNRFSQYELRNNVSASQCGMQPVAAFRDRNKAYPCKPFDFVLFSGGSPVCVIMYTPHNRDGLAIYKNAKATATQYRVPFINFFTQMENDQNYVYNRIASVVR